MSNTYWVSFKIHDDSGYQSAYNRLSEAIKEAISDQKWWLETTSFYLFKSELDINTISRSIKLALRQDRDLAVIGMTEYKTGRVVGNCADDDIFHLAPFMKKA